MPGTTPGLSCFFREKQIIEKYTYIYNKKKEYSTSRESSTRNIGVGMCGGGGREIVATAAA